MEFFIPDIEPAKADQAWSEMLAASERIMDRPYEMRRIRRLQFKHDNNEVVATVGEYRREFEPDGSSHHTGNRVLAIFAGNPYLVWEVPEGTSAWTNPSLVSLDAVIGVEDFNTHPSPVNF